MRCVLETRVSGETVSCVCILWGCLLLPPSSKSYGWDGEGWLAGWGGGRGEGGWYRGEKGRCRGEECTWEGEGF